MYLSTEQILSDEKEMTDYICERLTQTPTRVVLAAGEGGETWADLWAFWDDATRWHLQMEESDEYVDLEMVYDHFRYKEMSGLEWRREREREENRRKVFELEREVWKLREGQKEQREVTASTDVCAEGIILTRMERKIDNIADLLIRQKTVKEWYDIAEVARHLGRAEFTVREWCRLGHCKAEKKKPYRGGKKQWMIPHDELLRLESDGPAPLGTFLP